MSKAFIYTILGSFVWAVSIVVVKIIMNSGESPLNLLFWTTLLSSPIWLFVAWKNRGNFKSMNRKDWVILATTGVIGTLGINLTEFLALQYSASINYSFLIRTVILFTILFAYLFLGERLTLKKIIVAVVILIGAYLLSTGGEIIHFSLGDVFTIIEAILIAFGNNVLGKMAVNKMGIEVSASISYLFGVVPVLLMPFVFNSFLFPKSWLAVFVLIGLYVTLRFLRYRAYSVATSSYVTMIFSFTPIFVSIMVFILPFMDERMNFVQFLGALLITFAGIGVEKLKI